MIKKYLVTLTSAKRDSLLALTKKGILGTRKLNHTHILLQADASTADLNHHHCFECQHRDRRAYS